MLLLPCRRRDGTSLFSCGNELRICRFWARHRWAIMKYTGDTVSHAPARCRAATLVSRRRAFPRSRSRLTIDADSNALMQASRPSSREYYMKKHIVARSTNAMRIIPKAIYLRDYAMKKHRCQEVGHRRCRRYRAPRHYRMITSIRLHAPPYIAA